MRIVTNNQPRDVLLGHELTPKEREQFDYHDWTALENGEDSAAFFRYRGSLYDLGEFTADFGITRGAGLPQHLAAWDGYLSESAFSAVVVRYVEDYERVVVGTVLT